MLGEILGQYLDNGLNLRHAISDTLVRRKNIRQLPKNIKTYQKLLDSKVGITIKESEMFLDFDLTVQLFEKDKITNFVLGDDSGEYNDPGIFFSNIISIKEEQNKNSYFANHFKAYLNDIESGKIMLLDRNDIIAHLPVLMNQKWDGSYGNLSTALKNLTHDVRKALNISII